MTHSFRKTTLSCVISTLALTPILFGASSAGAQLIEEVIVTAQKRSENVQEIGMTISAFDAGGVEKAGIPVVGGLSFVVAGGS
jgi:iron complex outermembrane receptor protein